MKRLMTIVFGVGALVPAVASASYPAGVWGLVEEVVPEPDQDKPTRVRVVGLFMVAGQAPDFPAYPGYSQPAYGYMYYECPADQLKTCAMEWADLAAAAASRDKCRGWGNSSLPDNGSVRPQVEPPIGPDVYPIAMGVQTGFSPCDALEQWMLDNPPPPVEGTGGGDSDGTGGSEGTGGDATGGSDGTGAGGSEGSSSGGTGGTSGAPGTSGGTTGDAGTGGDASATAGGETGAVTGGAAGSSGGGGDETGAAADEPKEAGCACQADGAGAPWALMLGGLLALGRRRR